MDDETTNESHLLGANRFVGRVQARAPAACGRYMDV